MYPVGVRSRTLRLGPEHAWLAASTVFTRLLKLTSFSVTDPGISGTSGTNPVSSRSRQSRACPPGTAKLAACTNETSAPNFTDFSSGSVCSWKVTDATASSVSWMYPVGVRSRMLRLGPEDAILAASKVFTWLLKLTIFSVSLLGAIATSDTKPVSSRSRRSRACPGGAARLAA